MTKVGFYHKSAKSNKKLKELFERLQQERIKGKWENTEFVNKLIKAEKEARKVVLKMLNKGKVKTADDFYRIAMLFQHGEDFRSYALAVAFAAVSMHLGELWAKNLYAMALDRLLLSIGQKQYFGTNLEKKRGKWQLSPYRRETTDEERQLFLVEPIKTIFHKINKMNNNG